MEFQLNLWISFLIFTYLHQTAKSSRSFKMPYVPWFYLTLCANVFYGQPLSDIDALPAEGNVEGVKENLKKLEKIHILRNIDIGTILIDIKGLRHRRF